MARPAGRLHRPVTADPAPSFTATERPGTTAALRTTELARLLSLMGNAHRLAVLSHLAGGREMTAGELVRAVGLSQSALSQHLAKLRHGGLVTFRRQAQTLHYRIRDPRVAGLVRSLQGLIPKAGP